jgi:hypothetical protein
MDPTGSTTVEFNVINTYSGTSVNSNSYNKHDSFAIEVARSWVPYLKLHNLAHVRFIKMRKTKGCDITKS